MRSPADKVDHLEFVSVVERGLSPKVSGNDVPIQLDGDAVGFHTQGFDKSGKGERRGRLERFLFTVDLQFHG